MNAFIKFNKGLMNSSLPVKLWVGLLVIFNMIIPLFFLDRLEAQVVLAAIIASMAFMTLITATTGFSRLLGLGHIFWIPLVLFLVSRLDSIPATDAYGIWIRSVIALNTISLVLDAVDVVRFARGERSEIVSVE
ncbi:MAG: hypothetical protein IH802_09015 [Nitrospinae bacterium]|nr:hypothetical protein [Nitrospinota bacterium]